MTYGTRAGELWNELSSRNIKLNETDGSKEASSKLHMSAGTK